MNESSITTTVPAGATSGKITLTTNGGVSTSSTSFTVTSSTVISTFAGLSGSSGTSARFRSPFYITIDANGTFYLTDNSSYTIRKITSAGVVTTYAGTTASSGSTDATSFAAKFYEPNGIAVELSVNVYVADTYNHTIRKITSSGEVTTIAGTAGTTGAADGIGTTARFSFPKGITMDSSGNLFIADSSNNSIRKIVF